MGSAAALELTRRGHQVVLLERFEAGHTRGSSHGPTRIFRYSYPDPEYVQLAVEARDDWRRLERDSGTQLLEVRGGIDLGTGAFECADAMESVDVEVNELSGSEVGKRFPLRLPGQARAIFQPDAAVIAASLTVEKQLELAGRGGAVLRFGEQVKSLESDVDKVKVVSERGVIEAGVVVLAAGAWIKEIAAEAGIVLPLRVTREQVAYFNPSPQGMPVVIDWDHPVHYLVPQAFGAMGMRVGLHHDGIEVDPNEGPFEPSQTGLAEVAAWVEDLIGMRAEANTLETCLYTNAPAEDFILRRSGSVVILSPCSGHGFKFGPRIGRVAADLVEGKDPGLPERLV